MERVTLCNNVLTHYNILVP